MRATYADLYRPIRFSRAIVYDAILVLAGSLLIAASAQLKVHLWFSAVPVTGQTFAVLVLGALLGARRGALCVLMYLLEGLAGLPVFAAGPGAAALFGPTGGYLLGFAPAAYLTGALAQRGWDRRTGTTILAMALGNVVIHTFGVLWLSFAIGIRQAIVVGSCPFVAGDIVKIVVAACILPAGWKIFGPVKRAN